MRFFNTAGPVNNNKHYCLSPLHRFNLDEILSLIDQEKYFVLHAPRQTGKTTCLLALQDYLNKEGQYKALYVNVESAQASREDVRSAMQSILNELKNNALNFLDDDYLNKNWKNIFEESGPFNSLNSLLSSWSKNNKQPIILLIDEIDSLIGDTLISVLRQIRSGYTKRPNLFPQSIILCGVRDVRDYRIHSSASKEIITGGSAFNIKAESLRLGNFSQKEIQLLFKQHTKETGQLVNKDALDLIWKLTYGQPWLVNAIGYEACFKLEEGKKRTKPVTFQLIKEASMNLILRRDAHIDQLVDKLSEERVRRVIAPMLSGETGTQNFNTEDIQYLIDLGLIKQEQNGQLDIANEIYKEVIPRELIWPSQTAIPQEQIWYVSKAGELNTNKLIKAFQDFYRQHSEHWQQLKEYHEAGPQLLLQAFLQRIVNSNGQIEREYGLGRGRVDLFVTWKFKNIIQKIVIELKILHSSLDFTIQKGLKQTSQYMDKCKATEGHLLIFDRDPQKSWDEKIFYRQESVEDKPINVWGM